MLKFVERKAPNFARIETLLDVCARENQWANRGEVYFRFQESATSHAGLPNDVVAIPCANGGLALEGQARRIEQKAGRSLKWVVSSFSFRNIGRGFFASTVVVDCDDKGLLDVRQVTELDHEAWDGMIVVNPFGSAGPEMFTPYIDLARATGKELLLDNAAGFGTLLPDWPWQSVSFHHTKPYGVGEGGLAIVPRDEADALYALFDYGPSPEPLDAWLNNAKISDISCAFLLDRLERHDEWCPQYIEQAKRVDAIARGFGLQPLLPINEAVPCMSRAYLADHSFSIEDLFRAQNMTFGKYYQPIVQSPVATSLYQRLVNIPTHPDVADLSNEAIASDLERVVDGRA